MLRVLLLAARGEYAQVFSRRIANHYSVLGAVVPRPTTGFLSVLWRHRLLAEEPLGFACPVWSCGALDEPGMYQRLASLQADIVVSVGFPFKLPAAAVRSTARLGALNVHPSLLPDYAGPVPLFWQLKNGETRGGVTVHLLSDRVDAGDVLFHRQVDLPPFARGAELFAALAEQAASAFRDHAEVLASGQWSVSPQGPRRTPWARRPKHADFEVRPLEYTVSHLGRFVRGARYWGRVWARLADEIHYFDDVVETMPGQSIPGEFVVWGDVMHLRVKDGVVRLQLAKA